MNSTTSQTCPAGILVEPEAWTKATPLQSGHLCPGRPPATWAEAPQFATGTPGHGRTQDLPFLKQDGLLYALGVSSPRRRDQVQELLWERKQTLKEKVA